MTDYAVIKSKTLSRPYEPRYVIISTETEEILDDAQGYGYKTPQKAHAAWGYKNASPKQREESARKKAIIRNWVNSHQDFIQDLDDLAFHFLKGSYGPDAKVDTALIKEMLQDYGYTDLPFSAYDLLKYWKKH